MSLEVGPYQNLTEILWQHPLWPSYDCIHNQDLILNIALYKEAKLGTSIPLLVSSNTVMHKRKLILIFIYFFSVRHKRLFEALIWIIINLCISNRFWSHVRGWDRKHVNRKRQKNMSLSSTMKHLRRQKMDPAIGNNI